MTAPVNLNPSSKTDYLANAREGWGDALPDWVEILAAEADRSSGAKVAQRLGYSPAVVSDVIRGKYKGAIGAVEQKVRGAFMGAVVVCPVLDEIGRDRCLDEQKKKFSGTSAIRTRLFNACRHGCVHSRLTKIEETADA
jgi:hypothetical protein